MNAKAIIALYFILAQGALAAGASINDVCVSEEQIQKRVYMCGDNALAAQAAAECAAFVFARWKETVPDFEATIHDSLAALSDDQKDSLNHSQLEYQMNADLLDVKLAFFGKYADLIASYPLMMMDSPNGKDDASSAPCFNSAFHSVEKTVRRLDQEIVSTLRAKNQLSKLGSNLGAKIVAVNSSLSPASATSPMVHDSFRGAEKNPQSDITGTSRDGNRDSAGQSAQATGSPPRPGAKIAAGKLHAPVSTPSYAPATRQISRTNGVGALAHDESGWGGTKVSREIFSELEHAKTESPPAGKGAPLATRESLLPGADSLDRVAGAGEAPMGRPREGAEIIEGTRTPASSAKLVGEDTIFSLVKHKYRQLEPWLKK